MKSILPILFGIHFAQVMALDTLNAKLQYKSHVDYEQ